LDLTQRTEQEQVEAGMSVGMRMIAAMAPVSARGVRRWLFHLGGVGLIPLALLDNSPIPVPGAMDVAVILFSAKKQDLWLYYALLATAGAVLGGFLTFRIAHKGGKETLERKLSSRRMSRFRKIFERWGFWAIAIPALLPPPVPMVPFLFVAGAMQYPAKRFLAALTVGRMARYTLLAYFAGHYGKQIIAFMREYGHPSVLAIVLVVAVIGGVIFYFRAEIWGHGGKRRNAKGEAGDSGD
jgi:membrane protein YqaA with SNARE-associated domain